MSLTNKGEENTCRKHTKLLLSGLFSRTIASPDVSQQLNLVLNFEAVWIWHYLFLLTGTKWRHGTSGSQGCWRRCCKSSANADHQFSSALRVSKSLFNMIEISSSSFWGSHFCKAIALFEKFLALILHKQNHKHPWSWTSAPEQRENKIFFLWEWLIGLTLLWSVAI